MADEEKKKESLWDEDLASDSVLQSFMKENFYKRITGGAEIEILEIAKDDEEESEPIVEPPEVKGGATIKTTRLQKNMDCQMRGIDLVVSYPNDEHKETMNVEVKSALHYLNKRLPTFAMEIQCRKKDQNGLVPGWFIDKQKTDTTDYLFLWPRSNKIIKKEELHHLNENDIYFVETLIVKKDELKKYVRDFLGLTSKHLSEELWNYADRIRKNDFSLIHTFLNNKTIHTVIVVKEDDGRMKEIELRKKTPRSDQDERIKFYFSPGYKEEPVNLLIWKEALRTLSKTNYLVTKEYVGKYMEGLEVKQYKLCAKCSERCENTKECYHLLKADKSELKGMVKGYLDSIPDNSKFVVQIDSVWQIIREF